MKNDGVHAVIELRITPQRDCGFGKIAERVSRFEQVEACFLMSGGYDLLVFVKGDSLQDVAQFVAADLSTCCPPRRTSCSRLTRPGECSAAPATQDWRFRDGGGSCAKGAELHEQGQAGS